MVGPLPVLDGSITLEDRLYGAVDQRRFGPQGEGQASRLPGSTAGGDTTGCAQEVPDQAEVTQLAGCVEEPVHGRVSPKPVPDPLHRLVQRGADRTQRVRLVVRYLEGRRTSEILLVGLSCSYIISSGIVKDIGKTI